MAFFARNALLLLLLMLILIMSDAVTVGIENYLWDQSGDSPLKVHCKSKDDDLGVHAVPLADSYEFKFHPNIWRTTLFYCSFEWPGQFHHFDIYDQGRDGGCVLDDSVCLWRIQVNGPCRFNGYTGSYDLLYAWKD
ncbi:hypothetical protein ACFX13_013933 [Malus domestica]